MTLARRVRLCRYAKGWGPSELADRAKISRTALFQIESGRTRRPRAMTLRRVARALGLEAEALLGNEDPPSLSSGGGAIPPAPEASPSPVQARPTRHLEPQPRGDEELLQKFADLLSSPIRDWVAKSVEEIHRLMLGSERP